MINSEKIYKTFINSDIKFESLDEDTKFIIMQYIGIQCSPFISNNCPVRVTEEDIMKHVDRKIDIFELENHISSPVENSPKEIQLGGYLWKLKTNKYVKE